MDWQAASAELQRKLDPANVKPPRQYGPKGHYIEGWHAIAEANRIFGFKGWTHEVLRIECIHQGPRPIGRDKKDGWGVTYTATVRVTVAILDKETDTISHVVRDGCGAGHGYDMDLGLAHESAIKEAETDAFKRAIRTFGNPFGLALYDKERANVGVDAPENLDADTSGPPSPPKDPAAAAVQLLDTCQSWEMLDRYMARACERWGDSLPPDVDTAHRRARARLSAQDAAGGTDPNAPPKEGKAA